MLFLSEKDILSFASQVSEIFTPPKRTQLFQILEKHSLSSPATFCEEFRQALFGTPNGWNPNSGVLRSFSEEEALRLIWVSLLKYSDKKGLTLALFYHFVSNFENPAWNETIRKCLDLTVSRYDWHELTLTLLGRLPGIPLLPERLMDETSGFPLRLKYAVSRFCFAENDDEACSRLEDICTLCRESEQYSDDTVTTQISSTVNALIGNGKLAAKFDPAILCIYPDYAKHIVLSAAEPLFSGQESEISCAYKIFSMRRKWFCDFIGCIRQGNLVMANKTAKRLVRREYFQNPPSACFPVLAAHVLSKPLETVSQFFSGSELKITFESLNEKSVFILSKCLRLSVPEYLRNAGLLKKKLLRTPSLYAQMSTEGLTALQESMTRDDWLLLFQNNSTVRESLPVTHPVWKTLTCKELLSVTERSDVLTQYFGQAFDSIPADEGLELLERYAFARRNLPVRHPLWQRASCNCILASNEDIREKYLVKQLERLPQKKAARILETEKEARRLLPAGHPLWESVTADVLLSSERDDVLKRHVVSGLKNMSRENLSRLFKNSRKLRNMLPTGNPFWEELPYDCLILGSEAVLRRHLIHYLLRSDTDPSCMLLNDQHAPSLVEELVLRSPRARKRCIADYLGTCIFRNSLLASHFRSDIPFLTSLLKSAKRSSSYHGTDADLDCIRAQIQYGYVTRFNYLLSVAPQSPEIWELAKKLYSFHYGFNDVKAPKKSGFFFNNEIRARVLLLARCLDSDTAKWLCKNASEKICGEVADYLNSQRKSGLQGPMIELTRALGPWYFKGLKHIVGHLKYKGTRKGRRLDELYLDWELPKKSGGKRLISAPSKTLRTIQRVILNKIVGPFSAHPSATGFVPGKSIADNAAPHVGHQIVVNIDVHNCFPSVKWPRILRIFKKHFGDRFTDRTLGLLTDICSAHGGLPIGAPTSPALLNRILFKTDDILTRAAQKSGCSYSRYADDLTFSGDHHAVQLIALAQKLLENNGLSLDEKKTNIFRRGRRQCCTGLTVNDCVSVPRTVRRKLRAAVNAVENGNLPTWHGKPISIKALYGRLSFLQMIHPEEALKLKERLEFASKPEWEC